MSARGKIPGRRAGDFTSGLALAWATTLRRHPAGVAITQATDGRTCTFRELDARAAVWASRHLPEPRQVASRIVVFAAPNGIEWMEVFLALTRSGAVVAPLDAAEPAPAQRALAAALRAGYWWDGKQLVALPEARTYRASRPCLLKLTSGSTGEPRALAFTAAQLLADGRQVTSTMGIRAPDVNYALIPFGHSYGLGNLVLPLIAHGVPIVCGSAPFPQAIAADFARFQPTVFPGVPALWRGLAGADLARDSLASLRLAISAGAPLPPEVARDFAARFGRRIHNFYGSSETGGIAFDVSGEATMRGGVGRPMRGVEVAALSRQRLRVRSPAVFTLGNRQADGVMGAWIPPDQTLVGVRREITLLGRRGTTVKIAGRRVNLAEVAARLRQVAGVRDVWVGVGGAGDFVLGAAVASDRPAGEVRAALQADTAGWKIPKKLTVLAEFPLTARGKTDTRALHAQVFGGARK